MKSVSVSRVLATGLLSVAFCASSFAATLGDNCAGSNVAPPCTETTTSLGMFIIHITNPLVQGALGASPFYNPATQDFLSPLLFDQNTQINRGVPFVDGSASDTGDPSAFPTGFPGQPGAPSGFKEIHTSINSINLQGGGFSVEAGTGNVNSDRPASLGEVESLQSGSDFPARSFFDVFVDITIPNPFGPGSLTAINSGSDSTADTTQPLIVEANPINSLPPTVIYTHGVSTPALLFFENNPAYGPLQGAALGSMVLTGHGVGFTDGSTGGAAPGGNNGPGAFRSEFSQIVQSQDPADFSRFAPLITPEPSTLIFMAAGCGLLGLGKLRRRA